MANHNNDLYNIQFIYCQANYCYKLPTVSWDMKFWIRVRDVISEWKKFKRVDNKLENRIIYSAKNSKHYAHKIYFKSY